MKSLVILLIVSVSIINVNSIFKGTPKALDLNDHFGTETTLNYYGPQPPKVALDLRRRGVVGGGPISPIRNFNAQIQAPNVKSGDLLNTSYDASRIIDPIIASNSYINT